MSSIVNKISKLIETASKRKTNHFGYGAWSHHIVSVVKYSKILSRELKTDTEMAEISALLHDYASLKDVKLYPEHHVHGARLAGEILTKYKYPKEKIEIIQNSILTHRGSKGLRPRTNEARILASADSLAHFDNVDSLLYLAYVQHKMDINKGTRWVLAKLERSWRKLMPEAKEIIRDKYFNIKKALTNI